jgi:1-acyl-sn-glycerol-3-phosphate acyltransferase
VLAFIVKTMMTQFFQVDIEGWENLDQTKTPSAVMVANHQSAIDSLIFGYLWSHNFTVRARARRRRAARAAPAGCRLCARAGRLPLRANARASVT